MRTRNNTLTVLLIGAGCLFVYFLARILLLSASTNSTYANYSSLRADPMGTKALYDSLSEVGNYSVWRSFKPIIRMRGTQATIFQLGVNYVWSDVPYPAVQDWEELAVQGGRVIVSFESVEKLVAPRKDAPLENRLGFHFVRTKEKEPLGITLKDTFWKCHLLGANGCLAAERPLGKGTVVILTNPFVLSNEALRTSRDTKLIATLLGSPNEIIFDEESLGVEETGSISALMRRYGLTGAICVLLVLAVLFLWRGMSSLLPPRESANTDSLAGRGSVAGLVNLYRRAIPESQLISTCFDQWSKSKNLTIQQQRIDRMKAASQTGADPVSTYNAIARILREKL